MSQQYDNFDSAAPNSRKCERSIAAAEHSVISSNQLENGKLRLEELLSFCEAGIPEMIRRGKDLYSTYYET